MLDRSELSAVTYANWVHKTANLLTELDVEPDDDVWLAVLSEQPGHWVGSVWAMATWLIGASVSVTEASSASIAVTGPAGKPSGFSGTTVACSLHPLGLGFPGDVPGDVDFADVLTQPDILLADPGDPQEAAARRVWSEQDTTVADLLSLDPRDDRFMFVPDDPCDAIAQTTIRPLLGAGSSVVVAADSDRYEQIAVSEKALTPQEES